MQGEKGGLILKHYFEVMEKFYQFLKKSLLLFSLLYLAWVLLVNSYRKGKIAPTPFFVSLVLLTVFDLFYHNFPVNPVRDRDYLLKPSAVEKFLLKDHSCFRVHSPENPVEVSLELIGMWGSLRRIDCLGTTTYFSLNLRRYEELKKAWEKAEEEKLGKYTERKILGSKALKILSLLNVKYIISNRELEDRSLLLRHKEFIRMISSRAIPIKYSLFIYENPSFLPRAFVVYRGKKIEGDKETLAYMLSDKFNPAREAVFSEEGIPVLSSSSSSYTPARILSYSHGRIEVEVEISEEGYLVLSDLYYPGWEVWVDGEKTKIFQVDYLLRGVFLSPGKHHIVFLFNSFAFRCGARVSLIALSVIIILGCASKIWEGKKR
ncbi:MAG TPA: hypothetical protein ENG13_01795 [bacterium]|nr:hypothetical protein [bacterium]HEX67782.1 hypothetical protein [bacterium]